MKRSASSPRPSPKARAKSRRANSPTSADIALELGIPAEEVERLMTLHERTAVQRTTTELGAGRVDTLKEKRDVEPPQCAQKAAVIRDWHGAEIDALTIDQFEDILATQPDVVILGTGWQPVFVPRELTFSMARRGVGFEVMDTPAACRTFNVLLSEGRRPAALDNIRQIMEAQGISRDTVLD